MVKVFQRTTVFDRWLRRVRDPVGVARILIGIRALESGGAPDVTHLGSGLFELRIHAGPGYRVYFCRLAAGEWVLLSGGDKASQRRDIRAARRLRDRLEGVR